MRFGESVGDDLGNCLFVIKQTGIVAAYVSEFEDLSFQVPGLDDSHLDKIFYNGLKQKMKKVLKMKEPRGLPHQMAAVLRMESSSFCQLISEKPTKQNVEVRSVPIRSMAYPPQSKPLVMQTGSTTGASSAVSSRTAIQPRQRHSAKELDAMRSKGICFKCKGKYFRGHVCPLKELQILTVVDGLEL